VSPPPIAGVSKVSLIRAWPQGTVEYREALNETGWVNGKVLAVISLVSWVRAIVI
jgi:hypothetical protein